MPPIDAKPSQPLSFASASDPKVLDEHLRILVKAVEQSPVSVIITDTRGVIKYVNPKFTQLMGFTFEEAVGQTPRIIKGDFLSREFYKEMWTTILSGQEWHGVFHNRTKSGGLVWEVGSISPIRDDAGTITHFVGVKEDITEIKALQDQLAHMARHDQLTGLPNRFLFLDRFQQTLVQSRRRKARVGLMYLDLNDFKGVNDTYGHEAGDEVLAESARRLRGCVREADTVARMGGDEFTILLGDVQGREAVERIAENILQAFEVPFRLGEVERTIGVSIGVALFPAHGQTEDDLLSMADKAMYVAKRRGRNGFQFAE